MNSTTNIDIQHGQEDEQCHFVARTLIAGIAARERLEVAVNQMHSHLLEQVAKVNSSGNGLTPAEVQRLHAGLEDVAAKRTAATARAVEIDKVLLHLLGVQDLPTEGEDVAPIATDAPPLNAVQQVQMRARQYETNLLERAARFIAPCFKNPIVKKTMGKGAKAVTVCGAWPGIVSVYDPTTGDLLATSEPGRPDVLQAGFTRRTGG
jgi:hypothetical protein